MKPIFTTNNGKKTINYNATVFEILKTLDLTPEFLLEQGHCSNYLIIGIEFKDGELFPVKETVNCSDETFVNAVLVKRIGNGSECNCGICHDFSHQDDENKESLYSDFNHTSIFMDFYKSNFEDGYFFDSAHVTDSLEDSLQEVMEAPSGLLVNSQTSRFGDTHVGSASAWEKVLDTMGCLDENVLDGLSDATWEDTFRFPHLDE